MTKGAWHVKSTRHPSYLNYSEEIFVEHLHDIDWTQLYAANDPEIAWCIMKNAILSIIDIMCPIKTYNTKQVKDPWINNEILEAIHDKDRLLARAKRTQKPNDWANAKRRRNEVKISSSMLNRIMS